MMLFMIVCRYLYLFVSSISMSPTSFSSVWILLPIFITLLFLSQILCGICWIFHL